MDGKTTDQTRNIVKQYAQKDSRVRLIEDPKAQGVSENRNVAMSLSKGDYLAFLDADDLWHPEKLKRQIQFMREKNIAFSFHSYSPIRENGAPTSIFRKAPKTVTYQELISHNCIGCLTVMLKKTAIANLAFANEAHEDFCLWLDILKTQPYAYGMPESLAFYRLVANSRSNNKLKAALSRWKILRTREKLSLPVSITSFILYALSSFKLRM